MPHFAPDQLARWTGGRWTVSPTVPLSGFAIDTRQVRVGEVFVALKTAVRDGHDFLGTAAQSGASAAIVKTPNLKLMLPQLVVADPLEAFQLIARKHRRSFKGPVIGVTGSAGKTSTKNLLALLLGATVVASPVLATEGNLNNHLGVPLTLTRLDPSLHHFAVIEAGISGPGEMAPLVAMIEPDIAVTTLIGPAHVKELGTLEGVAFEKSRLSAGIRPTGVALYPLQCANFKAFADLTGTRIKIEPVEQFPANAAGGDTVCLKLTQTAEVTCLELAYSPGVISTFTLSRVTAGMAQNAALAICTALRLGVTPKLIQERLQSYASAALRGEWRRVEGRLYYIDCYNANPASMLDALATFRSVAPANQPRLYIVGGMEELGAEAGEYHRDIGRSLDLRSQDLLVTIGDYAKEVRDGVLEKGGSAAQTSIVVTHSAIAAAIAGFQGVVFVKGSRRYQLEAALGALIDPHTSC